MEETILEIIEKNKVGSLHPYVYSKEAAYEITQHIRGKERTPSWDEMCEIKNLFWDKQDCVIQYHPSEREYINRHKHTLHLWRPIDQIIPIPQKDMIG